MAQSVSSKKERFVFLDYLRISAAWLVVYDHMFGEWTARHGVSLRLVGMIRTYISNPFGIIQNFG
jgi:peptidoglycan/LPS O-acetylase OafA/YrhL